MKAEIDKTIFLNINILENEPAFQQEVLSIIGQKLLSLNITANLGERKYINNLITTEYLQQYNKTY